MRLAFNLIFYLFICGLMLQTGCALFHAGSSDTEKLGLVYKTADGLDLKGDLYLPERPGLKPAVIVVHGGGWKNRSGDMESICHDLTHAGFAAFNITYRLAPPARYPKAVEDVKDAIHWLREHADEYQLAKDQFAGWGYSAGAHLILLAGLDGQQDLKAIVAGGTPADLTAWPHSPLVLNFLGVTYKERPDIWKDASPIFHVNSSSPPVFMYHGEWDKLVEIDQMNRMAQTLRDNHRPVETHSVPYMGHIMVYLFSQQSVDLGIEFLKKQMAAHKL